MSYSRRKTLLANLMNIFWRPFGVEGSMQLGNLILLFEPWMLHTHLHDSCSVRIVVSNHRAASGSLVCREVAQIVN